MPKSGKTILTRYSLPIASFHYMRRLYASSVSGPALPMKPPSVQSSFAPCRCYRHRGRRVPPPERSLLLRRSYYELMRQTHLALLYFDSKSRLRSPCKLLPAPAASGLFPTLSLRIFPVMPGPLSRRLAECTYLFLPLQLRPSPMENGSAYRKIPLKRLHSGGGFRDCSHFFMFGPHSLLATLVAPTTTVSRRAVGDFYIRAERASLPLHAPDMLAVRIQAIDSTGTSPCKILSLVGCSFPAPATSHVACGFPALRAPAHFTSRVMKPIGLEQLSIVAALDSH